MPALTIFFGVALVAIGVGTYAGSGAEASLSSFILQLLLGLLAIGLGVGSILKKPLRMHLMHGAVILAVMGVIVPAIRFGAYLMDLPQDQQMQLLRAVLTALFSGVYVYAAVQSFRTARRNRKDGTAATQQTADAPAEQADAS